MTKIKKTQSFASYHVPLKKRSIFPVGAYFAIMPLPLYRDTKPIAVIIPEPDPEEALNSEASPGSLAEKPGTEATESEQYREDLIKDTYDFRLRHARVQRPFTIMSSTLDELCRVEPKPDEAAHYVLASDGTLLARIHRTSGRFFPWPRRARWHMEMPRSGASPSLYSAPKGTIKAWTSFVIFSPLWAALWVPSLLAGLLGAVDGGFMWDLPSRTKWRTGFLKWGLDFHGLDRTYSLNTETMDVRVAYAQAIIHSWSPSA